MIISLVFLGILIEVLKRSLMFYIGKIEHEDSLGDKGTISDGDVQWMTAGSGIIHQEMPGRTEGKMAGFQLWANLPDHKMMHPRYQDITQYKFHP